MTYGNDGSDVSGDITVVNHGTIFMVYPTTEAGTEWIDEHVDPDAQWFGGGLAVEHRYISNLVDGMVADGLIVR